MGEKKPPPPGGKDRLGELGGRKGGGVGGNGW